MSKHALKNLGYCEKALQLKHDIEGHFLMLGEYLYNIKEHNLYDSQWGSFEEFVFDLKMSQNMANKLVQIYKTFILGYGFTTSEVIKAGGWSVLQEILPMIDSRKSAEKWLNAAATLTQADLRKEVKELKTGIPMKNCAHTDTYTVEICRGCGDSIQKHVNQP